MRTVVLIVLTMSMFSCKELPTVESGNDYSTLFQISEVDGKTNLKTTDEFGSVISDLSFSKPFKRVVLLSTTYLAYVQALGAEENVVGVVDKNRLHGFYDDFGIIENAKCVANNGVLNIELISSLQPDLIICNSFQRGDLDLFEDLDLLVVNEFWESHPLGRAEWVNVFGSLFGKRKEASELFATVRRNYISKMQTDHENIPKVLNLSRFSSAYYLPGCRSIISKMLKDLNCDVACIDSSARSNEISEEQVLFMCGVYDYLMFFDWLPTMRTKVQVLDELGVDNCYKGMVVYCNTSSNSYFEASIMEPYQVMNDLGDIIRGNKEKTKYFTLLK